MGTIAAPGESEVRAEVVERVRARLARGEQPDADAVALAVLAWTCRRFSPAS